MDWRFIFAAVVLTVFLFRPPLGYDTYYFFTDGFHAPPLAKAFFSVLPLWAAPIVAYILTLLTMWVMYKWGRISPLLLLALPYIFGYTFRLEDDQLAFPFIVLSEMLYLRGRKIEGLLAALPALLLWRGTVLYIILYITAMLPLPPFATFLIGLSIGSHFINPVVGEQNPVTALFFLPIIYIALLKYPHKRDNLTLASIGASLLFPKWMWTTLPLLYYHAGEWWGRLSLHDRAKMVAVGVVAVLLLAVLSFPQPWLKPQEVCPAQTEKEWGIGWWCRAHGYDVPFAGSPPGSKVTSTTS